jgi:glutathione peroxidase
MSQKYSYLVLITLILSLMATIESTTPSLYSEKIEINTIEGAPLDLSNFKGKKLLLVNTASECGYTSQYKELQSLSEDYKTKIAVLGIPCNQFGNQEPGTEKEIVEFCKKNYGVTFTMTEKIMVKGNNQHQLYQWLTKKSSNGLQDSKINWNFQKYLLDENGQLLKVFPSSTAPLSSQIIDLL